MLQHSLTSKTYNHYTTVQLFIFLDHRLVLGLNALSISFFVGFVQVLIGNFSLYSVRPQVLVHNRTHITPFYPNVRGTAIDLNIFVLLDIHDINYFCSRNCSTQNIQNDHLPPHSITFVGSIL